MKTYSSGIAYYYCSYTNEFTANGRTGGIGQLSIFKGRASYMIEEDIRE